MDENGLICNYINYFAYSVMNTFSSKAVKLYKTCVGKAAQCQNK